MQTSWIALAFLLIARATIVELAPMATLAPNPSQNSAPYELIFEDGSTTEQTGSITLRCRNSITAEDQDISEIRFFLNRTSVTDLSLREREDIRVVEVGRIGVKFNLTRRLEGNYTCGKRVDATIEKESPPKTLISLQKIIPLLHSTKTNYTAMSGDRVVLQCPIQPGALLQQYSVRWEKDNTAIAEATNPQSVWTVDDARYKIDRATYSLIIDSVMISDASSNYQCKLSVMNPTTETLEVLQPSPQVTLSLNVIEGSNISSGPTNIVECNPTEQPSFSCVAIGQNAPNITWTYISNGGEEVNLTDGDNYRIESNISQVEDGLYAINSTITFLNLAFNVSSIVRCKINVPGAASADAILVNTDCPTNNKNVALHVQLIALAVSFLASIGIGLILIVVTCVYCIHVHRKHKKSLELCSDRN